MVSGARAFSPPGALLLILLFGWVAGAQPAETAPVADALEPVATAPDVEAPAPDTSPKALAREYFMRGVALFEAGKLDAALAEFRLSRATFETRVASRNLAVCLQALDRHDEALEVLEQMLREPDLTHEWRRMLEQDLDEAKTRVGIIAVTANVAGATVLVSGRMRGKTPLASPVVVSSGSHLLRVSLADHAPYETRVEVAGNQRVTVTATLAPLGQAGSLRVLETRGRKAEVVVDQVVVGPAPWSGRLPLGNHTVTLKGEGDLGTQPAAVRVASGAPTTLSLELELLNALLRVEPVPAGARVALDGVDVGNGLWEGRVRPGKHRVEVAADGFITATREVGVAPREVDAIEKIVVELERDPSSERWAKVSPPRIVVDADLGFAIAPSFGGELADACGDCSGGPAFGGRAVLRAGYRFGIGFGLFLDVGYLGLYQKLDARSGALFSASDPSVQSDAGTLNDELAYQALVAGAAASYHHGDPVSWHARLGVGALVGSITDRRSGTFSSPAGGDYEVGPYVEDAAAHYLYISPEARLGYRVADHVELSVGLAALIAFNLKEPMWEDDRGVPSVTPFYGQFNGPGAPRSNAGHLFIFVPGLGAAFDF